ncbi:3-hydroxyacyl-CoA dehydrogenase [Parvularcula flava]|uniref:3-hydroxyacyl-CoA dehydrogenase n=1 Tax=Aquisalinus luteolus TaxID=1566827 RepID=A0A8J3A1Q6_9PROT|nr:3-hydroxyacyl-CoA dehydrogenase NAD-binding domain-containing protein [Aquisalinus luteolus]NHK26841.1 3-hydroxyacyl-CoA dehydrogenase [Aquisalinus luteolus]GGH93574.1 3-hydroxyacyl-CoA dehydrogenase [Aquisalinus luteolus]
MSYETIKFDVDSDGIALITIDLPDQSMNVWNAQLIEDFEKAVDEVLSNDDIKGAVIASGKESGFMAGADLRMLGDSSENPSVQEVYEGATRLNKLFRKMETGGKASKDLSKGAYTKPFAAAINGLALGGGLEVCLASHYRVASDSPKVQIGLPEVLVGLLPGAGGTQRVPRLAGIQNAMQMCTTGSSMKAEQAKSQNLIHDIVPHDDLVAKAKEWVKANPKVRQPWDEAKFKFPGGQGAMDPRVVPIFAGSAAMAQKQTFHNMPQVDKILSCIYEGSIVPIDVALRIESKYFTSLLLSDQTQNMIRTLFINKQAAEKGMARPKSVDPVKLTKVGVLGAGMMGAGIAYVTARSGMEVVLLDRDVDAAEKGKDYSRKLNDKGISKGKLTKGKSEEMLARIKTTADYDDLKDVDLIIEAVFEDPKVKADVIRKTEAVIGKDVVFASNTSTIPITSLAKNSERPDQFIGIHFFSPVDKMPLVEIIPGDASGDLPLAAALDYVKAIKKTPIVVSDTRGFYCNSVVVPYLNEAARMVKEGINPALIDNCARNLGMPVGPLALMDETSQELGYKIMMSAREEMGDAYQPTGVDDLLEKFVVELGRKGRKSGGGFYEYPEDGGKKYIWPGLKDHFPLADNQPSAEEVEERLLFIQLAAVAKCYSDDVVHDPQSADLGAIFGWGFAPWTGGPMSYIDTIGVEDYVRRADALAQQHGERYAPPASFRKKAEEGGKFYAAA